MKISDGIWTLHVYIILLLSMSISCHSVALWSFFHYDKLYFVCKHKLCVNIPGQQSSFSLQIVCKHTWPTKLILILYLIQMQDKCR